MIVTGTVIIVAMFLQMPSTQTTFARTSGEESFLDDGNKFGHFSEEFYNEPYLSIDDRIKLADIDPLDPMPKVGEDFTLTCTLTDHGQRELNSSLMYFAFKKHNEDKMSPLSPLLQTIVDTRTLRLRIQNIQLADAGVYSCRFISHLVPSLSQLMSHDTIRETEVIVGVPPSLPAISCTSNNMLDMTCSWCGEELTNFLAQYVTDVIEHSKIEWDIRWKIEGGQSNHVIENRDSNDGWVFKIGFCQIYFCGSIEVDECNKTAFFVDRQYYLTVAFLTPWGNSTSAATIYTNESIGKVRPVENVNVDIVNGSMVWLKWKKPSYIPNRYIIDYLVTYNDGSSLSTELTVIFDNTMLHHIENETTAVVLSNLLPYTTYHVCIRGRMKQGTLLGECTNITFLTDIAVPGRIEPSTIFIDYNSSLIKIIWDKPDTPNGPIDFYRLLAWVNDQLMANDTLTKPETVIISNLCNDRAEAQLVVALSAVNRNKESFLLEGMPTKKSSQILCEKSKRTYHIIIVSVSIFFLAIIIVLIIVPLRRLIMKNIRKSINGIDVTMPTPNRNDLAGEEADIEITSIGIPQDNMCISDNIGESVEASTICSGASGKKVSKATSYELTTITTRKKSATTESYRDSIKYGSLAVVSDEKNASSDNNSLSNDRAFDDEAATSECNTFLPYSDVAVTSGNETANKYSNGLDDENMLDEVTIQTFNDYSLTIT